MSNLKLKEITLEKEEKLGTLTHIILMTHSHKSLSNGSDSKLMTLQAKHCTDMEEKLQHWIKESQTHHITGTSPYNPHRI